MAGVEDEIVCNNEKLQSGSTASYVRSCKHFLDWEIFQEGADWPSVIMAPSNMIHTETAANLAIEVRENRPTMYAFGRLDVSVPYCAAG